MKKKILIVLFITCVQNLFAGDYYWVGGGGNWSDLNHWRLGSAAGSIPSIVPSSTDNVFFGSYSGFGTLTADKTVTLDANGYCNNMTWESTVPNSPRFVPSSGTLRVEVWGNLSLSSTTTYNISFAFKGATANTLNTNGRVLGSFTSVIEKATGGTLAIADSLVQSGSTRISLISGTFDIAGKKIVAGSFTANNNNERTLEMTNAHVTVTGIGDFRLTGANKTLHATGSYLESYVLYTDGVTFNKVVCNGGTGSNQLGITSTTFSTLTFANILSSQAYIGTSNTVSDSLIFLGTGQIGYGNVIGYLYFSKQAQISGSNNVIRKIECADQLLFPAGFTLANINTVDSLLLAPNRLATLDGTLNINKYLYLSGASCEAITEVNGDSVNGVVNFATGAVVDMSNVLLTGVKATGSGAPFSIAGIDGGGNAGFDITEPSIAGTTLYWVGGPGDWNDRSHWSTASGGAGGACIPFINDDVVFNANSGLAGGAITTSSSSFCHNMTWEAGVGTATFAESGTSSLRVYGSVILQPSVTMDATLEFDGEETSSTITTNGSTAGDLELLIRKSAAGSLALLDNWSNTNGTITLIDGELNMANRTVSISEFVSGSTYETKNLNINGATITVSLRWAFTGLYKTMDATGSHITSNSNFNVSGLVYPWVDLTYAGTGNVFSITGTTFGQLTFTSPSSKSQARIAQNNVVRRLEFKGRGAVTSGGNSIDSLILAPSQAYSFSGTTTINKYILAESPACSGLLEMRGAGTLAFASGVDLHMSNIYMKDMTATGPVTPIVFNGADAGGNTGWTINTTDGGPRYWVGGSGDWSDPAHWSATSGGSGGTACVPTVYDDVYFDAGSGFTGGSKTVTINNGNAYCYNINWTGAASNPVFSKTLDLVWEVWGTSVVFNPATTINTSSSVTQYITLKGANATTIQGNAPAGNFDIEFDKSGGSATFQNDFSNANTDFVLTNGAFNVPERTITVNTISNADLNNASSINISNATINTVFWRYSGSTALHALTAANSTITTSTFAAEGFTYNKVNVAGITTVTTEMSNTTIDSLIFTNSSNSSTVGIGGGNNTLNYVEYKGSGGIYGTNNIIDTLVFFPGNRYVLNAGTNTTITGEWYGSGTPCRLTEIVSNTTTNATITKTSGDITFDYVRLQRMTGTGGATYSLLSHSTDMGGNVNWNIAPYDGAAPIYGLGPDTAVVVEEFPITLRTDGFFGSPSSQFTWNDNSTADTLVVNGAGIYSITAFFVDGCSIKDTIVVSERSTLPVTLVHFTASVQNCESYLQWEIADAVNFSYFVVEKSEDGARFAPIETISYSPQVSRYSYADKVAGSNTMFYRLKLVDVDGRYRYSAVASVRVNCGNNLVRVYPTVTSGSVQVILPRGYEEARVFIINIEGQRMTPVMRGAGSFRSVNVEGLPAGAYILQVINGREIKTFKIIKQ